MKYDGESYDKCNIEAILQQDYAALAGITIPVTVSMVSFQAINVAEEYSRIKEQKKDKEVMRF